MIRKIREECQIYTFNFPNPNSFGQFLFAPRMVTIQDGTIQERLQRCFIDNGDFYTRGSKFMNQRVLHNEQAKAIFSADEVMSFYKFFDGFLLVESFAGRAFYLSITSMILRSIELFTQSVKNTPNFLALHGKMKVIVDFCIAFAVILFTYYSGHAATDIITFVIAPVVVDKFLSFTWSNYFRQINTLSSTKDFELSDFISKNIRGLFIRMFIPTVNLLRYYQLEQPAWVTLCKTNSEDIGIRSFEKSTPAVADILLEPIMLILAKMFLDLVYIFMVKRLVKNADLRDPMGWMFSKFRSRKSSNIVSRIYRKKIRIPQEVQTAATHETPKSASKKTLAKPVEQSKDEEIHYPSAGGKKRSPKKENARSGTKQIGKQPKDKEPMDVAEGKKKGVQDKTKEIIESFSEKQVTYVNIEVGTRMLSFQQLYYPALKKEIWGVIIADSVEKQSLEKYEDCLASGYINGTRIAPLKGFGGKIFEIRPSIDSRLIGMQHEGAPYPILQHYMPMEEALQFSRELERHGINGDVFLIAFSDEAKNHKNISGVAQRLFNRF